MNRLALFLLTVLLCPALHAAVFDCHVKSQGATSDIGVIQLDTSLRFQRFEKLRLNIDGTNFMAYCNVDSHRGRADKDIWCGLGGLPGSRGASARAQTSESAPYLLLDRVQYSNGGSINGWFEVRCEKR